MPPADGAEIARRPRHTARRLAIASALEGIDARLAAGFRAAPEAIEAEEEAERQTDEARRRSLLAPRGARLL